MKRIAILLACALATPAQAQQAVSGVYSATPPTLSDQQQIQLQLDASGNLKTATTATVAQGSTTSGQSGTLVQCAVTTSAPTYTTAQTDPLSCTTTGGLRTRAEDGSNIGLGSLADAAWTSGNGSAISVLKAIDRDTLLPLAAGTNLIGKAGIDQTTVGTTNGVSLAQVGATTVATGNGVVGAGVQRVAIASDNAVVAVIGNGAAPTDASTNAITPLASTAYNLVYNGASWDKLRGDVNGGYVQLVPTAAAAFSTPGSATTAAASSLVAKGSAGNLFGLNVTTGASAGYVLIFNATSAPGDGAVTPARCIPLAANSGLELNFRPVPIGFTTGITIVFSTTGCFTKTASATAFIAADVK